MFGRNLEPAAIHSAVGGLFSLVVSLEQATCLGGDPLFSEQRLEDFHTASSPVPFRVGDCLGEVSQ